MVFKALKYKEEECGKKIAHTKRKYVWVFEVDSERHQLQLVCSFMSGKRVVLLDSAPIHQSKHFKMDFEFKYSIGYHNFRITQNMSAFPLYVDNTEFIALLKEHHRKRKQEKQRQQAMQSSAPKIPAVIKIPSNVTQKSSPFSEFQDIYSSLQKPVSNIKFSDFGDSDSDPQSSQKVEIEIERNEVEPQIPASIHYPADSNKPSANKKLNEDLLQIGYNDVEEPQGLVKLQKKPKAVYIPTPAEIFHEKKEQLRKLMKL